METTSLLVPTASINIAQTLRWQLLGQRDPTGRREEERFTRAFRTAKHPARIDVTRAPAHEPTLEVTLRCHESDVDTLRAMVPGILGLDDTSHAHFDPEPKVFRDARARAQHVRLVRVPWLYELLVGIVLQQRVAYIDAVRSHHWLAREFGERFEDDSLRLFPSPQTLMRLPPEAFRQAGVDRERADRLRHVMAASATPMHSLSATTGFPIRSRMHWRASHAPPTNG